jgi:cobalt-zinc-cadmium efflux system protein
MDEHPHNHDDGHADHDHGHDHSHAYKALTVRRLGWSLGITASAMVIEFVGGLLTGSVALVSDAGHMLTHAFALAIAIAGILVARLPACHHRTFGLLRAEVVAAFVNALFLLALTVWIAVEAVGRLLAPQPILTLYMLVVAVFGLVVNLVSVFLIEGSREGDINVQSVFAHMVADAASSVAIVVAAVVIRGTGWVWLDPVVAMGIGLLIVLWAWSLLRESLRVLLEMAPKGRNVHQISSGLREHFPAILDTNHEHVWTITPDVVVFSAHLTLDAEQVEPREVDGWLRSVEAWLAERFDVRESTLQVTWSGAGEADSGT